MKPEALIKKLKQSKFFLKDPSMQMRVLRKTKKKILKSSKIHLELKQAKATASAERLEGLKKIFG